MRSGYRFAFFTGAGKLSRKEVLGPGAGDDATLAALSLCEHLDVFGEGLASIGPGHDLQRGQYFDGALGTCDAGGGLETKDCPLQIWIMEELRLHLYDALGILNFVWW